MTRDTYDMFKSPERGRFGEDEQQHRPGRSPKVTGASDLIDLTLPMRAQTQKAIQVTDYTKPGLGWIWLPKSQIEYEDKGHGVAVVTLPEWLARDKGLL
jgi:hypothetical protein